ncbi:hypothetical protein BDV93DRAFT_515137 [Ceratobasidium sp. AG-I]|nr:hypothetical protein BDV93DRAFT_515137 [Ceratobasidium sp. AG-I]
MRTRAPTVFDVGGEVCLRHKVIEDPGIPVDGGIVSAARHDGNNAITSSPSRTTSPTYPSQAPNPFEARPASPEPMGNTPTTRLRKPQRCMRLNGWFTTQKAEYKGVLHQRHQRSSSSTLMY